MARARTLKPGFFKNEDLAECSPWARLCFAGLWTLADREGRLEDRAKRIKGELFAFDSIEVEPLLVELAARGFILRYSVEGRGLIQIVAFEKHQNPHHREPSSDLPPPKSPGLGTVGNAQKPEAQPALHEDEALGEPGASPGLDPPRVDLATVPSRADTGIRNTDTGKIPPHPPRGEGRFAEFWTAWPAGERKQDRKKCLAKWQRHGWDSEADAIVSHVVAMKASRQWREGFEPAPLTYLNGERWRDGVPIASRVSDPDDIFAGAK